MLFVEFRYLLFFLLVFGVHWTLRNHTARKAWLLLASYGFYAGWNWHFLSLILVSTLVDYVAARKIPGSSRPKLWLGLSLLVNLGMLGICKYLGFFVDSARRAAWAGSASTSTRPTLDIVLPVGISFYTFQTLSYTHRHLPRHDSQPTRDPARFGPLRGLLPAAGGRADRPRPSDFLPQLAEPDRLRPTGRGARCLTPVPHRLLQEGGVWPTTSRRWSTAFFAAPPASTSLPRPGWPAALRGADLLRLLGLLGHGHRVSAGLLGYRPGHATFELSVL